MSKQGTAPSSIEQQIAQKMQEIARLQAEVEALKRQAAEAEVAPLTTGFDRLNLDVAPNSGAAEGASSSAKKIEVQGNLTKEDIIALFNKFDKRVEELQTRTYFDRQKEALKILGLTEDGQLPEGADDRLKAAHALAKIHGADVLEDDGKIIVRLKNDYVNHSGPVVEGFGVSASPSAASPAAPRSTEIEEKKETEVKEKKKEEYVLVSKIVVEGIPNPEVIMAHFENKKGGELKYKSQLNRKRAAFEMLGIGRSGNLPDENDEKLLAALALADIGAAEVVAANGQITVRLNPNPPKPQEKIKEQASGIKAEPDQMELDTPAAHPANPFLAQLGEAPKLGDPLTHKSQRSQPVDDKATGYDLHLLAVKDLKRDILHKIHEKYRDFAPILLQDPRGAISIYRIRRNGQPSMLTLIEEGDRSRFDPIIFKDLNFISELTKVTGLPEAIYKAIAQEVFLPAMRAHPPRRGIPIPTSAPLYEGMIDPGISEVREHAPIQDGKKDEASKASKEPKIEGDTPKEEDCDYRFADLEVPEEAEARVKPVITEVGCSLKNGKIVFSEIESEKKKQEERLALELEHLGLVEIKVVRWQSMVDPTTRERLQWPAEKKVRWVVEDKCKYVFPDKVAPRTFLINYYHVSPIARHFGLPDDVKKEEMKIFEKLGFRPNGKIPNETSGKRKLVQKLMPLGLIVSGEGTVDEGSKKETKKIQWKLKSPTS
ncbi:MAG: hypothetical protein ACHQUC_07095 [Chlamydiales bacterium]